ncbi:MAG: serine hydrolase [Alteromonadaceae bacterium]|nr:serine hydrolase [Alteromonadaceae bacterium]
MKKCLTIALAGMALISACSNTPDYDAMYLERFNTVKENGGMMPGYSPMEVVSGAENYQPLPHANATEQPISKSALDSAQRYAEANNSTAFIVWHEGKVLRESYFNHANRSTPIVSKSLSKPLGAIAIGRAIQLNKIDSTEQSVADFITEWKGTAKEKIKIKHLLNMTSGLLPQGYSTDPMHPWNTAYLSYEHDKILIHDYPLASDPGSEYGYSNASAELVAIIIERATGQRYADFIGQQVLAPIGAAGGEIWVNREGGLAHSGCCMTLPAESWLRLAILLLNDGVVKNTRLLPEHYVDVMKTPSNQNVHYGLGVWLGSPYAERRGFTGTGGPGPKVLHSAPYIDPLLFLFDGNSNQVVYISPTYNTVILRVGKTPPKQPEWDNSILPNILLSEYL